MALLFAWCVFGTGLRWRHRVLLIAGAMVLLVGLRLTVRVEGVSGDIVPRLAWRWAPNAGRAPGC